MRVEMNALEEQADNAKARELFLTRRWVGLRGLLSLLVLTRHVVVTSPSGDSAVARIAATGRDRVTVFGALRTRCPSPLRQTGWSAAGPRAATRQRHPAMPNARRSSGWPRKWASSSSRRSASCRLRWTPPEVMRAPVVRAPAFVLWARTRPGVLLNGAVLACLCAGERDALKAKLHGWTQFAEQAGGAGVARHGKRAACVRKRAPVACQQTLTSDLPCAGGHGEVSSSDAAARLRHAEERAEELKAVAAERGSADLIVLQEWRSLRMLTLNLKPLQGSEL